MVHYLLKLPLPAVKPSAARSIPAYAVKAIDVEFGRPSSYFVPEDMELSDESDESDDDDKNGLANPKYERQFWAGATKLLDLWNFDGGTD